MRHPKFVVTKSTESDNNVLTLGLVDLHKDIIKNLKKDNPNVKCYGGGMFYIDNRKKIVYFYGQSYDFGKVQFDVLKEVLGRDTEVIKKQLSDVYPHLNFENYSLDCENIPYFLL